MVEPVYPTYQRPTFNIAPIVDTANRFALQQKELAAADQLASLRGIQIDKERAMSPLEIAAAQRQDRMGALAEEDATALSGAQRDYRKRAAAGDPNATDALSGYPELKARVTATFDQLSASDRDRVYRRTAATAAVTKYVLEHGNDPAALDFGEKVLVEKLGATPDEAAAWKAGMANPFTTAATVDGINATNKIMTDLQTGGKAGSSYETVSPELRMKIDAEASRQVNGEKQAAKTANPLAQPPTPEEIAKRKADAKARIIADMFPGTTYGSIVDDKARHAAEIAPAETPEEKAASEAAAKAETGPKSRGPVPVEAAPEDERSWWERNAPEFLGGKTVERYTGDASNEKAMREWWNALDDGATVANPGYDPGLPETPKNPRFLTKHSNFK